LPSPLEITTGFPNERQVGVIAGARDDAERVKRGWTATALPSTETDSVRDLLAHRKYVVLEGPPGTGKTDLATRLPQVRQLMVTGAEAGARLTRLSYRVG
jgi:MoxR-like ATPase